MAPRYPPLKNRLVPGVEGVRTLSPSRLNASVVIRQDSRREHHVPPGHLVEVDATRRACRPSSAVGGTTPRPRNDKVASKTIDAGMSSVR